MLDITWNRLDAQAACSKAYCAVPVVSALDPPRDGLKVQGQILQVDFAETRSSAVVLGCGYADARATDPFLLLTSSLPALGGTSRSCLGLSGNRRATDLSRLSAAAACHGRRRLAAGKESLMQLLPSFCCGSSAWRRGTA